MSKAKRKGTRAKGRSADSDDEILLGPVVDFLHEHITEELCKLVFSAVRITERARKWTLFALARFWLAVVLEPPPSLTQLLEKCSLGERAPLSLLPTVEASAASFFQRCKNLSPEFFTTLYTHFVESVRPKVPTAFANPLAYLRESFTDVVIIDGSRLDKIAHRLKILWDVENVILPGCVTAVYDLFRGIAVDLWFSSDAAEAEHTRGLNAFERLRPGSLALGDRLYCSLQMFEALDEQDCFGLFRRKRNVKIELIEKLGTARTKDENGERVTIEDWLVWAGTGKAKRKLRLIRLVTGEKTHEAVTNQLDPTRLSAKAVVDLYPLRWQVERLFFDLKEVLNLNHFYAANPNAIAMQVYAAAMIHVSFRIAQAQIAEQADVRPEQLSPKKLFPRLSLASITVLALEYGFDLTQQANPSVDLKRPDWSAHPNLRALLSNLLVQRRRGQRKRPGYSKERAKWKSFTHLDVWFQLS